MDNHNWQLYLSRPFNLFETSLWDLWYSSGEIENLLGMKLNNGLYIESPKGSVRHYRQAGVMDLLLEKSGEVIMRNPDKYYELLKDALELNKEAEQVILVNKFKDLIEAINFLLKVAQRTTILPYFVGLSIEKGKIDNPDLLKLSTELRAVSYYPKLLSEVVNPIAKRILLEKGFSEDSLDVITYQELLSNDFNQINDRLVERKSGKTFVYKTIDGREEVEWTNTPTNLVDALENTDQNIVTEIKGMCACPGWAKGKVRIILSNTTKGFVFDEGDILVSISTSPELLPFMKKAGAIVTDEGGITSHAAIISRELNIPCVIGTKIGTRILKDGDMLDVDATSGIVRII